MKNGKALFFRAFFITAVIILCIGVFIAGIVYSYKAINATAYAKRDKVVEYDEKGLRILDFYVYEK